MSATSSRMLSLLSLMQARRDWPGGVLAERLDVTPRTVRRDIERLRALISQMGGLAEHAIGEAMRCLIQRDYDGAIQVVEDDDKLDALETETESRVVQLIALRAPMAGSMTTSQTFATVTMTPAMRAATPRLSVR